MRTLLIQEEKHTVICNRLFSTYLLNEYPVGITEIVAYRSVFIHFLLLF